jgi:hypothetical protein
MNRNLRNSSPLAQLHPLGRLCKILQFKYLAYALIVLCLTASKSKACYTDEQWDTILEKTLAQNFDKQVSDAQFQKCVEESAKTKSCLKNLDGYLRMLKLFQPNPKLTSSRFQGNTEKNLNKMKLPLTDEQYFEEAKKFTRFTPFEEGENSLKDLIPLVSNWDLLNIKTTMEKTLIQLDQQGYKFIPYFSSNQAQAWDGSSSQGRLLILSEKDGLFQSSQFVVKTGSALTHPSQFSTVATKGEKTYFEDMERIGKPSQMQIDHASPRHPLANASACYSCHISGPLQIHPDLNFPKDPVSEMIRSIPYFQKKYLTSALPTDEEIKKARDKYYQEINSTLDKNKTKETAGLDKSYFGPKMGLLEKESSNRDKILDDCLKGSNFSNDRRTAIKNSMQCSKCHNNKIRGAIYKNPFSMKSFVKYYVVNVGMPPNNDLNPKEREALFECLSLEMDPKKNPEPFKQWLTQTRCSPKVEKQIDVLNDLNKLNLTSPSNNKKTPQSDRKAKAFRPPNVTDADQNSSKSIKGL